MAVVETAGVVFAVVTDGIPAADTLAEFAPLVAAGGSTGGMLAADVLAHTP